MRSPHRRLRYELLETRDLLTAVQIADGVVGHPAGHVTVPVDIDDATGVRAAEIRIEYDTAKLDVLAKDITAGSAWNGKAIAMANIDEQAGTIVVFVFSAERLTEGTGSLIDVSFRIRSDVRVTKATVDLVEVRLNEGQIELTATPVSGVDTTDGLITIKRDKIRHVGTSAQGDIVRACFADGLAGSQELFVQPLPPPASTHPLHPSLADKPAELRRGSRFIGPSADLIFAATEHWSLDTQHVRFR